MKDFFERLILIGLGLMTVTKEKVEKFADELVEKGKIKREDVPQLIENILQSAERGREKVREVIQEEIKNSLDVLNLPTKKEINEIKKKLEEIDKKIGSELR